LRLNYIISIFICIFISCSAFTQTYNYSYTDPCTGNLKTIVVPINGNISVGYYGEIGSFSYADFTNGTFEQWANNIFAQYGQDSPCATIVGIGTAVTVTQNTTFNVLGILNSLSTIADAATSGASNILGGSVSSIGNSGGGESNSNEESKDNKNGNSNSNNSTTVTGSNGSNINNSGNGNESATQSNGPPESGSTGESGSPETSSTETGSSEPSSGGEGTSTEGSTTEQGGSGGEVSSTETQGGSGGNGSGGETTQETPQQESGQEQTEGKSNITGTATTTTKNAPSKSEGGKPSVVASSDFVGFNFRNSEVRTGAKATGGYTAMRWDGKRSYGALADYTTALKGPNITGFYAWIGPKAITLLSGTATIGFDGNKSLYGTIAAGQMFSFKKVKSLKVVYMATASYGHIFREQFVGTALIAGAMYDMKIGKRFDIKLMNLMVYAPYVSYYNDIVLASPYVMLPSIGTNIKLTKKFKFNINAGGAWDLKTAALNYTVTCGTRIMIGQ
jgi:hypothetical protein